MLFEARTTFFRENDIPTGTANHQGIPMFQWIRVFEHSQVEKPGNFWQELSIHGSPSERRVGFSNEVEIRQSIPSGHVVTMQVGISKDDDFSILFQINGPIRVGRNTFLIDGIVWNVLFVGPHERTSRHPIQLFWMMPGP